MDMQDAMEKSPRSGRTQEQRCKEFQMRNVKAPRPMVNGPETAAAPLIGLETYDPEAVIKVLQSFLEQDAEEHRATLEFLMRALNEGRPEGHKMFPEQ